MSISEVEEGEIVEGDELDFQWGNLKEKTQDDIQLYESFTLDGVEYCLYDCVYMQHEDESSVENHIGKIVKIMDHPDNQKEVKIVWFFRPRQVQKWLREREVSCLVHELFLASGEGLGVANINPVDRAKLRDSGKFVSGFRGCHKLSIIRIKTAEAILSCKEAIVGKCCVVCISKDRRNPQPSIEERRNAEFVFSRTFDVQQCTFSHKLDNIISGIKGAHSYRVLNAEWRSRTERCRSREPKSSGSEKDNLKAPIVQGGEDAKLKSKGELHHSGSLRSTSFEETPASLGDSAKRSLDGELKGNAMLVRKPKGGEDAELKPKGKLYHSGSLRSTSFEDTASLGDSDKRSPDGEFKGNAMLVSKPKGGEDKLKPKGELHRSSSLRSTSVEETASLGDTASHSLDGEFKGNAMLVQKPKGGEDPKLKSKGELYRSSSMRSTSVEETASLGDSAKRSPDGEFKGNAMLVSEPKGGEDAKLKPKGELHRSSSVQSTSVEETASLGDSDKRSPDGEFKGNAMLVSKPKGGEDAKLKPKGELHRSSSLRSTSVEETASLGDSDKLSLDGEFNSNAVLVRKPKGGDKAKLKSIGELYHSSSLRSTSVEETASLGDSAKRSLDGDFNGNAMLVQKPKGGEDAKLKPKGELHRSSSLRSTSVEETASLGDTASRSLDGEFKGNAMLVQKSKIRCKDAGMSSGIHVSHDRKIDRGTSFRLSQRKTVKLAGFHVSHDRTFDRGTSSSVSLTKTGDLERKEFAPKPAGEKGRKDVQVIVRKGPTKIVVRRAAPDLAHQKRRNTQTQYSRFREPGKDSVRHDRTTNDKKLHLNERREGATGLVRQHNLTSRTLNRNDKRSLLSYKEAPEASQRKKIKSVIHTVEAQRNVDRSKWFNFKQLPSEEEVEPVDRAYSEGTLVRLQNLDPSYSAAEIEEIIMTYLNVRCIAKVLPQCTFSSPHNGQAFLIFGTEEKAEAVIKQLRERYLMLPNGRPLTAHRGAPRVFPETSAKFFGHITLDRYRHRGGKTGFQKRAVSTSHCAQSNTVEYELALDWILLQRQSKATRKALFELHGKELDALKAELKNQPA
ncbi:hypothetical protein C5167_018315 [Papaver somniferum]|uniref:BAH domain-containing protein n=1 Tax=Papaver somniferum TaxID=3469 RepID=A0A4Y7IQ88_PAPSO|nr:hypothetical protein C5167_018315 [Papaver somniferum]